MPPAPLWWLPVTSLSSTHAAITYRSNLLGVRLGHGRTPGDIYKASDPIDLFRDVLNTMLDAVRPYVGNQQTWQSRESLSAQQPHTVMAHINANALDPIPHPRVNGVRRTIKN